MVLQVTETLCVASVGVSGIHISADMWVFQILAVHFVKLKVLCSPEEAKGAIEFVVISRGFNKNVVLLHVIGDCVHGLLDKQKSADGILEIFRKLRNGM